MKKAVFRDDQDRVNLLNTLQHVNKRYNWICHAYCLMTLSSPLGIGQKTIWTEVRGQTILGEEGFVDKPVDHMKKRKDILEIP